jgi:hypothetical protein
MCSKVMDRAYEVSIRALREKIRRDNPTEERQLQEISQTDVIVVRGQYDRVQDVLRAMDIPFTLVSAAQLDRINLSPSQVVFINCPGKLSRKGIGQIHQFVEAGGFLVTTDWALRHVIEPAFPGLMRYNDKPTRDDVVRIEILEGGNRFLEGLVSPGEDPQWWLEGSSYPIEILDQKNVEVLITSKEMAERYGEAPIAVTFNFGLGAVFHIVSHYYLQRSELRTARHEMPSTTYFAEKGLPLDGAMEDLPLGYAESAYNSASFIARVITSKKKGNAPLKS